MRANCGSPGDSLVCCCCHPGRVAARGWDVLGALGCVLAGMDTVMLPGGFASPCPVLKPSTLCTERRER